MSFRKRNLAVTRDPPFLQSPQPSKAVAPPPPPPPPPPGIRPSPINGQLTTSTGTPSLDSLLAGHAGLPLGCSLLIEEPGTTDYGGALLRYYAAEGIVQGHAVTVVGLGHGWVRDLPAVTGSAEDNEGKSKGGEDERMKIAWRYERLGEFGSGIGGSRAQSVTSLQQNTADGEPSTTSSQLPFCHSFDLTKRLTIPSTAKLSFIPPPPATSATPFASILTSLTSHIASHPSSFPHRILLPSLLSPLLYPPSAASPSQLLPFLHSLRSLLRQHPNKLTLLFSLPLELYPRDTGLIRWAEILSDGVIELTPLPHQVAAPKTGQEPPQGLVRLWKLPVLGERGGGVGAALDGAGEDLAFTVTRKRFEIKAYSLPPADEDVQQSDGRENGGLKNTKVDVEF